VLLRLPEQTGQVRVNPVMYRADGGRLVVFASQAGADTNPDWLRRPRRGQEFPPAAGLADARRESRGASG